MKSIVGLILGIVGSILNMCVAMIMGILFIFVYFFGRKTLIEYNLSDTLIEFSGTLSFWLLIFVVVFMAMGVVGLVGASMMNRDFYARKGGVITLLSGIFSLNLFMVIGGIMGIVVGGHGNYGE